MAGARVRVVRQHAADGLQTDEAQEARGGQRRRQGQGEEAVRARARGARHGLRGAAAAAGEAKCCTWHALSGASICPDAARG
eukprot:5804937-Prymnesium_polylepis.1